MKKKLYEAQKNYLTCGILMIIVGIAMFFMPKTSSWAWGCIGLGVLFVIGFLVLLKKDGLMEVEEEVKPKKKIPSTIEKTTDNIDHIDQKKEN